MSAAKKKASGATIPEAVRAQRGTGKVKSFRLGLRSVAILEAYAKERDLSQSEVVWRLLMLLRDHPTILHGHEITIGGDR